MNATSTLAFVTVSLAGETRTVPFADALAIGDALHAKHGGVPTFTPCDAPPAPESAVSLVVAPPAPQFSQFGQGKQVVDDAAATRITALHATLNAAGVKVDAKEQFFATGTRMAVEGYETQATRKREHDTKVNARDAAEALRAAVAAEDRRDERITARDFARNLSIVDGKIAVNGLRVSEQALRGLLARIESPSLGYVLGLRERIGAERDKRTVDHAAMRGDACRILDTLQYECERAGSTDLKLRTRRAVGDVFAVVSPAYAPADAPEVLAHVVHKLPSDAKASWSYDAHSTQWELRAEVWTPTPTAEQAVGEPFSGYVSFQARDNGTARFTGGGGVMLLRCLNASTYTADESSTRRVHRGRIMFDIQGMMRTAMRSVDALCNAWGKNRTAIVEMPSGLTINDAIPGFWRYLLTDRKSELAGVLAGRSESHITGLTRAFHGERRITDALTRSDLAQGWTKYIQERPDAERRTAEAAIGDWLMKQPKLGCDTRTTA